MKNQLTVLETIDIERIISRMAHEILEKHRDIKNLVFIGIHTRGVFIARRLRELIHELEGAGIPTGEMDITLYRDDWTIIDNKPIVKATHIDFAVDGKDVILIDDVLFTGRTTRAAMDALIDFGRPARIELAVLVDRGHRELPIQADYAGKYVETKRTQTVNVQLKECDQRDLVTVEKGENRGNSGT